jgi:hypothetical protein
MGPTISGLFSWYIIIMVIASIIIGVYALATRNRPAGRRNLIIKRIYLGITSFFVVAAIPLLLQ